MKIEFSKQPQVQVQNYPQICIPAHSSILQKNYSILPKSDGIANSASEWTLQIKDDF